MSGQIESYLFLNTLLLVRDTMDAILNYYDSFARKNAPSYDSSVTKAF